jgi:DNA-binding transcriptional LysR family regulator
MEDPLGIDCSVKGAISVQISHARYFLALCRDENFTLAAKRCGISQPSLTNAIKRFERELGGPLFHRSLNGTTLSELGQAVRPHLERLIQCADDARRAAKTVKSLSQVSITTTDGGLDAKADAFYRRRSGRSSRHNGFDQDAGCRERSIDNATDNLG